MPLNVFIVAKTYFFLPSEGELLFSCARTTSSAPCSMLEMSGGLIQLHANDSLAKSAQRTNRVSFTLAMSRFDSVPDVVATKFAIQMSPRALSLRRAASLRNAG